jgi:hypothetical protein
MSAIGQVPTPEQQEQLPPEEQDRLICEGALSAFRDVGCTRDYRGEEAVDPEAVAKGIFPIVMKGQVSSLADRVNDAISKGDLTARLLPGLVGPDDAEWDSIGVVGQGVWSMCERKVWDQTSPNLTGRVQVMVRSRGLTLCHTKISRNHMLLPAVYVTADLECLKQDFELPLKTSVRNAANKLAKNTAAAIETHPEHAKQLAKEVESGMKNATQLAKATLALAAGEPEEE